MLHNMCHQKPTVAFEQDCLIFMTSNVTVKEISDILVIKSQSNFWIWQVTVPAADAIINPQQAPD